MASRPVRDHTGRKPRFRRNWLVDYGNGSTHLARLDQGSILSRSMIATSGLATTRVSICPLFSQCISPGRGAVLAKLKARRYDDFDSYCWLVTSVVGERRFMLALLQSHGEHKVYTRLHVTGFDRVVKKTSEPSPLQDASRHTVRSTYVLSKVYTEL